MLARSFFGITCTMYSSISVDIIIPEYLSFSKYIIHLCSIPFKTDPEFSLLFWSIVLDNIQRGLPVVFCVKKREQITKSGYEFFFFAHPAFLRGRVGILPLFFHDF